MKNKILVTLVFTIVTTFTSLWAQHNHEKCATMTTLNARIAKDPSILTRMQQYEKITQQWLSNKSSKTSSTVITIPVVFHIIHDGEAVGTGNNVPESVVLYQLKRINEDFRKLNADTLLSNHPFYPLQADCEIEFCLAKRTPSGAATTGIIRHDIAGESWTIEEVDTEIKPTTIWDRNKYVNFWCVNLDDPESPGVDGYATFPTETSDSTDGVVVSTNSFGYVDGTDKSITATHELGHFFNLLHIWGDGTCASDSIADTPPAEQSNSGCPNFPYNVSGPCAPGANGEMFMNYMDYSDAECVVMFTKGQKARMLSAIATFRSSLTTSNGCTPTTVGIDEQLATNSFAVFPNPASDNFQIEISEPTSKAVNIGICDQFGSIVKQINSVSQFPVNISTKELQSGVYFIKIVSDHNIQTKKILIIK